MLARNKHGKASVPTGPRWPRGRRLRARRPQAGFSAMEITMVATVVAILAMIALPVFLERLKDAREKAALDEMSQISKAQQIAFADTEFFFRLQDLDNTKAFTDLNGDGIQDVYPEVAANRDKFVPSAYWDRIMPLTAIGEAERMILIRRWSGPYMLYQPRGTMTMDELASDPVLSEMFDASLGPVPVGQENGEDLLPIDPWGTPYFFFGPTETSFNSVVIYSLGPDGLPGAGQAFSGANLQRDGGVIGQGDDLVYKVQ